MNTTTDMKWFIDERIKEAQHDGDNWRLAQAAQSGKPPRSKILLRTWLTGTINRLFSTAHKSQPTQVVLQPVLTRNHRGR